MRTNNCGETFVAAAEELHRLVVSRTGCQHRRPLVFRLCFAFISEINNNFATVTYIGGWTSFIEKYYEKTFF